MDRLQAIVQEIADQERSRETTLMKTALSSLPYAAFIILSPFRVIAWCNTATSNVLGHSPKELIGQNTRSIHVDEAQYQIFDQKSAPFVLNGVAYRDRFWMLHASGYVFPSEHFVTPIQILNDQPAVISFVQSLYGAGDQELAAAFEQLTSREREVFDCVRKGYTAKYTAELLGISPRTVEVHRDRILSKFGHANVTSLLAALLDAKSTFLS